MSKILIVGCESGIGHALHRKLGRDHLVSGTSRDALGEQIYLRLEDRESWHLTEQYDQVYYCIGVGAKKLSSLEIYNINALLTVEFLDYLADFVNPGGLVRVLSSITGSITRNSDLQFLATPLVYKMSKAALNMGVSALHHKHKHVTWQLLHPGLVKTKMTAGILDHLPEAIDPDTCADYLTALPTGPQGQLQFLNYNGNVIPW